MNSLAKTALAVGSAAIVGTSAVASTLTASAETYYTPVIPPFIEVSGDSAIITRDYIIDTEIETYLSDFYDGDYLITVSQPLSSQYIVDHHNETFSREEPLNFSGEEKYWVLTFVKFQCSCDTPSTSEDSPYYNFTFFPRSAFLENMSWFNGFTDFRIPQPMSFDNSAVAVPDHDFYLLDCLYSYPDDAFVSYTLRQNGPNDFLYNYYDFSYVIAGKFMMHDYGLYDTDGLLTSDGRPAYIDEDSLWYDWWLGDQLVNDFQPPSPSSSEEPDPGEDSSSGGESGGDDGEESSGGGENSSNPTSDPPFFFLNPEWWDTGESFVSSGPFDPLENWEPSAPSAFPDSFDSPGTSIPEPSSQPGTVISKPTEQPGFVPSKPSGESGEIISRPAEQPGTTVSRPVEQPGTTTSRPIDQPGTTVSRPTDQPGTTVSRPADQPGSTASRPVDQPGTTTSRPTDQPGTTVSRPAEQPGSTASRPTSQPGTTVSRPADQPGSTASRPTSQPGTTISRPTDQPGTIISPPTSQPGTIISKPES